MFVCGTKHPAKQRPMQGDLNVSKICYENFVSRLVYISFPFFPLFRIWEEVRKVVIDHEYKA
jgi:hypothetical protein